MRRRLADMAFFLLRSCAYKKAMNIGWSPVTSHFQIGYVSPLFKRFVALFVGMLENQVWQLRA